MDFRIRLTGLTGRVLGIAYWQDSLLMVRVIGRVLFQVQGQGKDKDGRSISHPLERVKSRGGAARPLSVAGLIACKDASLFHAFLCSRPPPSVV